MSAFWSAWIIVLTTVTLVLLVWLLFATRKLKNPNQDNTTGHVYDGITEEDNPLPGWWFTMFIVTIIFGVGYLIAYPGMGNFSGLLNWSSADEHDRRAQQVAQSFQSNVSEFTGKSITELAQNTKARNMGRRLFATNCSVCHGAEGKGGFGFPNLTDAEWQWGGTPDQILHSIKHGRQAVMVSWKDALGPQNLTHVVNYVASLTAADGAQLDAESVAAGQPVFMTYCSSCHGAEGKGNQLLGAPSLVDDVWLYGGSTAEIMVSVSAGRNGQMPAHSGLLSEDKINLIAAYVLGLSSQ